MINRQDIATMVQEMTYETQKSKFEIEEMRSHLRRMIVDKQLEDHVSYRQIDNAAERAIEDLDRQSRSVINRLRRLDDNLQRRAT